MNGCLIGLLLVALAPGVPPSAAQDATTSDWESRAASALKILLQAERVYDADVGPGGERMAEYLALTTLVQAGRPAAVYARQLIDSERPAARVYGAILLVEVDPAAADEAFSRLEEEVTTIEVVSGCGSETYSIEEIARWLRAGGKIILTPSVQKLVDGEHAAGQLPN